MAQIKEMLALNHSLNETDHDNVMYVGICELLFFFGHLMKIYLYIHLYEGINVLVTYLFYLLI